MSCHKAISKSDDKNKIFDLKSKKHASHACMQ